MLGPVQPERACVQARAEQDDLRDGSPGFGQEVVEFASPQREIATTPAPDRLVVTQLDVLDVGRQADSGPDSTDKLLSELVADQALWVVGFDRTSRRDRERGRTHARGQVGFRHHHVPFFHIDLLLGDLAVR